MNFFGSLAQKAQQAVQNLVSEEPVDKEYEAHKQSVNLISSKLNDIKEHTIHLSYCTKESSRVLLALNRDFSTLFGHFEHEPGNSSPPPAFKTEMNSDLFSQEIGDVATAYDRSLDSTCHLLDACILTVDTVASALSQEHHRVEKKRKDYESLRYEVRQLLESGQGPSSSNELEQKSAEMDKLLESHSQAKCDLSSQYFVLESTSSRNVQNVFASLFEGTSNYFQSMDRIASKYPALFQKYKEAFTQHQQLQLQQQEEKIALEQKEKNVVEVLQEQKNVATENQSKNVVVEEQIKTCCVDVVEEQCKSVVKETSEEDDAKKKICTEEEEVIVQAKEEEVIVQAKEEEVVVPELHSGSVVVEEKKVVAVENKSNKKEQQHNPKKEQQSKYVKKEQPQKDAAEHDTAAAALVNVPVESSPVDVENESKM